MPINNSINQKKTLTFRGQCCGLFSLNLLIFKVGDVTVWLGSGLELGVRVLDAMTLL